jgi:RNA polymerase sigma-70 factor (ECF subfamily)
MSRTHGAEAVLNDRSEAELIGRLRAGDLDALGELYRQLGGVMTTLARSLMRDRDEADDIVEQALLRIHEAARGFRGERGLRTWTLRIVTNLCRDQLRRRKHVAGAADDPAFAADPGLTVTPVEHWDARIDQAKVLAALETAIEALPGAQREAVLLRDRLGLSYAEVAETLGVNENVVKQRLFRARENLRRALTGQFGEEWT